MPGLKRALAWLGITEDDEMDGEVTDLEGSVPPVYERREQPPRVQVVSGGATNVAQQPREDPQEHRAAVLRPFNPQPERAKIHLVLPTKYADVQEIGDRMKSDQPVIINLEGVDRDLRRRIIDFSSGLTYALGGKVKEISTSVYLLSPARVEVADEEMFRMRQRTVAKGVGLHGS
ncbi:cell division protein SepF [Ferrimicrobium sp.]|uniref:cell division protein SepF n=1 Tax=Ferrimicrobium sp. TaxID=2926050 RepID=UPI00260B5ECF|nr:cell division protein SepF [Ferrimicrobium sp.]